MAKTKGTFFSLEASGTIGKCVTASIWRGVQYVRKHFVPKTSMDAKHTNIRAALTLAMAYWLVTKKAVDGPAFDAAAAGTPMSGTNLYMKKALDAYMVDPTNTVTPTGVTYTGTAPDVTFAWTHA
jgi:hypothetical protein